MRLPDQRLLPRALVVVLATLLPLIGLDVRATAAGYDGPLWGMSLPSGSYQQGAAVSAEVSVTGGTAAVLFTAAIDAGDAGGGWRELARWTVSLSPGESATHTFALPDQASGRYPMRLRIGDRTVVFAYVVTRHAETNDPAIIRTARSVALEPGRLPRRARLATSRRVRGTLRADGVPMVGQRVMVQVAATAAKRGGWATVPGSAVLTDAHGRFALAVPTYYYGRHTYRIEAPAVLGHWTDAGQVLGWAEASSVTAVVRVPLNRPAHGGAGHYRFLVGAKRAGSPARWNGCVPIPYSITGAHAPAGAARTVRRALVRVSAATGLRFVYRGRTSYRPYRTPRSATRRPTGITFAWASPRQAPKLSGDVLGYGDDAPAVNGRWTSGVVVLDRTFRYEPGFRAAAGRSAIGLVLLHEMGHVLGLAHVRDRSQVMYPVLGRPTSGGYQAGDLTGLHRLGLEAGCV
ncbi:matrixin family metalloprotease [Nocardioides sp. BP30]|uniref:matrixin family metalloprotease n=1 Tax=Nocardioides sp. BP30 TaxID=3036374 RepID=UPI0024688674|nr:matrixin family metalloprotease [Nocardioides sp. BP30]WGL53353.1 matrixin family metalloprotease [Nocardioides sp. BP30]